MSVTRAYFTLIGQYTALILLLIALVLTNVYFAYLSYQLVMLAQPTVVLVMFGWLPLLLSLVLSYRGAAGIIMCMAKLKRSWPAHIIRTHRLRVKHNYYRL